MITDAIVSEVSADNARDDDLSTAIAGIADNLGLLFTQPGKIVIIAGDNATVIRTLRLGGRRTVLLGDLQLGRALCSAAADWATWAAHDLASGRVEAELRTLAWGSPAAGQIGRTAP
jgi:hypothetical protein